MDLDGVWASLCFPSFLPGFVGQRLTLWPDDDELALVGDARVQRLAPRGVVRRAIPTGSSRTRSRTCATREVAADEIRRNAARGFKAVTFSEAPDKLGLPTIHSGYWDPLFAACAETEHRAVPARRLVGHVADDVARRAARDPGRAVRRVRHVQRGRLAVLEGARCASPTSRSACRKAASAGSPASSTGSTTATATSSATCRRGATST